MSYNGAMKKRYTPVIKAKIVTELLKEEKTLAQLSSEFGVSTKQLTRWKNHTLAELPRLFEIKIWNRAMATVKDKMGSIPFTLLQQLLIQLGAASLGLK